MSTTWENYRSWIRVELGDESDTPKWTDSELLMFYNAAMKNYSQFFPLEQTKDYTPVLEQREYDLPTDIMHPLQDNLVSLEYPENHWVKPLRAPAFKPGTYREVYNWLNESVYVGAGLMYYAWGESLFLTANPDFLDADEVFQLRYFGLHKLIRADAEVLSIPSADEELIMWYVTSKAYQRVSGQDASLSRWNEGGRRDDSPLLPEHRWRYKLYLDGLRLRRKPEHKRAVRKTR